MANIIVAGLLASFVLSFLQVICRLTHLIPFDVFHLSGEKILGEEFSKKQKRMFGFFIHLIVGVAWAVVYYVINTYIYAMPFQPHVNGMIFSLLPWLVQQTYTYPRIGKGHFAKNSSGLASLMSLVVHLLYGAVLGYFAAI